MNRKIASVEILLFVLLTVKTNELGQENKPPLTKDEILRLLKAESRGRLAQTNIVIEVAERGIAFPVDGPTLEELRRAGAKDVSGKPSVVAPHLLDVPGPLRSLQLFKNSCDTPADSSSMQPRDICKCVANRADTLWPRQRLGSYDRHVVSPT